MPSYDLVWFFVCEIASIIRGAMDMLCSFVDTLICSLKGVKSRI